MTTPTDRLFDAMVDLNKSVGGLDATVQALREDVKENAAREERAREKIEATAAQAALALADAVGRIEALEAGIAAVKPFAAKADKWEREGIWAAGFIAALGAVFGGSFMAFREKLLAILFGPHV